MATHIKRILCPVDCSETSVHAVEQAVSLAGWYQAPITALHVYNPLTAPLPGLPVPAPGVPQAELDRVREETWACLQTANTTGVDIDVVVEVGAPARCILTYATSRAMDLIVMGTHGTGGFEHLVLGSVTEKVLRQAACPVLTVPPRARATSRLPFKHLLCAVDFSDWSVAALEFARSIAEEAGASLTLLHVVEWPWKEPPAPVLSELPPAQAAALGAYRCHVEKSATDLRGRGGGHRRRARTRQGEATMNKYEQESHYPGFVFGLMAGAALGAGVAMYFAPKLRAEIRKRVVASAKNLGDTASEYCEDVNIRVNDAVEDVAARGQKARDAAADVVARGAQGVARGAREIQRFAEAAAKAAGQ